MASREARVCFVSAIAFVVVVTSVAGCSDASSPPATYQDDEGRAGSITATAAVTK
jgi:hypothetical protein